LGLICIKFFSMKRVLLLALLFLIKSVFPQINNVQNFGVQSPPPQRTCGTDPVSQQYEAWVASLYPTMISGKGVQGGNNTQSTFNIPVIVHIVHNNEAVNNPTVTTGNNLNAAQIIDQINILNRDYNGTNPDTTLIPAVFKPLLGKFQMNFCLAVVNATGGILAEPGIDRINRNAMGWTAPPYSQAYCDATIKPASIWNVNKYFNIWVMPLSGGLLGYATFPDPVGSGLLGLSAPYGNATSDGVVCLNTAFGSVGTAATFVPYNKGRTATHEVGHWIGLRHIWGDASCGNDYCNDTPTQQTQNFGCPTFPQVSCANGPNGNMFMNYMDYVDDACMYMFTKDQKYRAQLIMANSPIRAALATSTVCNLPTIGNDIAINYVVTPTYSQIINCNNKITPVIRLNNLGSTTITTATVMYNCDGVNTQTIGWAGSLTPSASVNFTLPQIINLVNGAHAFNATVTAPNGGADNNLGNNYDNQLFSIVNSFTMTANSPSICAGQTTTLTGSGGAVTYSWNPGAIVGSTAAVSPTTTTIYTLTGTSGTCQNTYTTSVTISGSLAMSVNNASICTGQTATLTASGAATYTWNTGSNNASIAITPTATTVYTVSGTSGSCNGSITSTVTVNTTPTVTVNSATICSGNAAILTASGAATYSWSTGAVTSSISVSPGGTSVYTVTGNNGSCANTKTTQVNVTISPTVSVNNATICSGSNVTLTATGALTYSWNTGAVTSSIVVSPTATTNYTVVGTSAGCTDTRTTQIGVTTSPTVTVNSATICSGTSTVLTANGAATYSWSTGANTNTVSVSPGGTTVYTVTGNNGSCANTKTTQVNVTISPTVSVNNATICSGSNVTLTATGAISYSWNTGAVTSSIVVSPTATTNYTVVGTSAGCTDTRTTQIGVITSPTVTVNTATVCSGIPAILTASGAATYSWSTGAVTASISVNPGGTTVYTVTGNNGSCANTKTTQVNVNISPTVSVNNATICSGSNVTLTATGAASYSWNTGAVTSSIVVSPTATANYTVVGTTSGCADTRTTQIGVTTSPTVTVNSATICSGTSTVLTASGAATYSWSTGANTNTVSVSPGGTTIYTVTGNNGSCANTKTVQVNVNTTPTVGVNSATICSGNNALLTANGALSYSWSTGANTNTVSVSPGGTTVYTVTGTSSGCANTKTTQVTVNTTPTLSINSATICPGSSVSLTANGATNYTWSTGSFVNPISVSPGITTVYTATGVTAGCFGTSSATVTIGTGLSVFINPVNQSICSGGSATMTASGATTYTWSTGSNAVSIVVTPTSNTTYSLIGATGSCTGSANSTVNISPAATISMNIVNASCNGLANGAATINASGGATPYTYSFSTGGNIQSTGSLSANTYTAIVTTSIGCVSSVPFTIAQPAPIAITSTITPASCGACNGSVTFTASGGTPSFNFTFMPGPSNTNLCAGSYTVFTSDNNGCSGSAVVNVGSSSPISTTANIVQPSCGGCTDGSVTINIGGGTGPYTYSWSPSVSTGSTATGLGDGCYTVTVTDASLCTKTTTFCLQGSAATGLNAQNISNTFNLYPNPASNSVMIEFGDKRTREISMIDVTGRVILLQIAEEKNMQLNVSPFANGVYFIRIMEDRSIKQVKVIKQ
jgi:hypothetical protein